MRPKGLSRIQTWILRAIPKKHRDHLVGDLLEEYDRRRSASRGARTPSAWLWREIVRAVVIDLAFGFRDRLPSVGRPSGRKARVSNGNPVVESMLQDIRYAVRTLLHRPLFTVIAVATLGLGIGGATVIYTVADSAILQKLPYPHLDRLVSVWTTRPNWRGREGLDRRWDRVHMHYSWYQRWREGTSTFDAVALYKSSSSQVMLPDEDRAKSLSAALATASLQDVLGFRPSIGRWFLPGEDGPDAPRLVVLGHRLWQRRFAANPNIIGSTLTIRNEPYTIVGVAPPHLRLREMIDWGAPRGFGLWRARDVAEKDLWLPVGTDNDLECCVNYEAIGLLRRGVSIEQATAEITPLIRGDVSPERRGVRVKRRSDVEAGGMQWQVLLLAVPSSLLLIIACCNITTLLLGEAVGRRQDILTRMALGAGKVRVARQLLTESVLLGLLGSALAFVLAALGIRALVALAPPTSPIDSVTVSWQVLAFASAIGAGAGALFGLAPAVSAGGNHGALTLRVGPRVVSRRSRGFQSGIVALEIALTVILLVGGGLFVRTLTNLLSVDLGFDRGDVAVVRYRPSGQDSTLAVRILEQVGALPGVESASTIQSPPMTSWGGDWDVGLEVDGTTMEQGTRVNRRFVSPEYHETMRIRLLAGRYLSSQDDANALPVAVVSETMARSFWPNRSAIGGRFRTLTVDNEPDGPWINVVGVVADVRHHGFTEPYVSIAYMPFTQGRWTPTIVLARASIGVSRVVPAIRSLIESTSGVTRINEATTMEEIVSRRAIDQQYRALLVVTFGAIAVVLASAGVFGVAARRVALQRREIGIRKALGAREHVLVGALLRAAVGQAAVGLLVGLALAFLGRRFVAAYLYGVGAADAATYITVGVFLIVVCLMATFVPARRIAAVDPAKVLREE